MKSGNGAEISDLYTQFIAGGIEDFTCKSLRRGRPITLTRKTRTYIIVEDN
jgi:hypothetical protein